MSATLEGIPIRPTYRRRRFVKQAARYVTMSAIAAVMLLPIIWILVSSIRPAGSIFRYTSELTWRTFIPDAITWDNYRLILSSDFPKAILNTVFVGIVTAVLGVFVNSAAGFAFAVFDFPFKRVLFASVLASFMVPFESIVIPLYQIVQTIGWVNSYQALIVPGIANGLVIFLFRQFVAALPTELYDAARADGANWFQVYMRIVLPLAWPTVVTGALMLFIFQWEAFFWPLVVASDTQYTVVQVAIARNITYEETAWGQLFSSMSVAILIPLCLYMIAQRYYVRTIVNSGLK